MSNWIIDSKPLSHRGDRSTIPHDPGFEVLPSKPLTLHGSQSSRVDYQPAGRVRPEAREIARRHHSGTVGILFQTEARPYSSKKPAKKDYLKANFRRIRDIERSTQTKLEPPVGKKQPVIKSAIKYRDTPSRLGGHMRPSTPSAPRPLTPSEKNFIALNNRHAADFHVRRAPSADKIREAEERQERHLRVYKRGSVPNYLRKRQEEWNKSEMERISKLPDRDCPPGHVPMPDSERIETLNLLSQNKTELLEELKCLPMRTDTLKGAQKKSLLENKLAEIDDAIKIFSRKRVFVKQD